MNGASSCFEYWQPGRLGSILFAREAPKILISGIAFVFGIISYRLPKLAFIQRRTLSMLQKLRAPYSCREERISALYGMHIYITYPYSPTELGPTCAWLPSHLAKYQFVKKCWSHFVHNDNSNILVHIGLRLFSTFEVTGHLTGSLS